MKKLLLTIACVLGLTAANAATITLDMANATAIQGEFIEESTSSSGAVTAAHYQPVTSLIVGDYQFAMTQEDGKNAPAYYTATEKAGATLRMYTKNTLTITAPAGVTMRNITFTGTNGTANDTHTVNTGALTNITTNSWTWAGEANTITITMGAKQFRITSLEISDEAGTTPEPDPTRVVVTTLAQAKALAEGATNSETFPYQLNCSPVVAYTYGAYTYVYDGTSYALLYKSNLGLNVGDKLKSGSTGVAKAYNNLIELVPDAVEADGTATAPSPKVIAPADIAETLTAAHQDEYITINNVNFATAGNVNGTVEVDGQEVPVVLYNRFAGDPVKEGTFNVTGFIAIYNTTIQIYYTALERVGEEPEPEPLEGEGEGTLTSPYNVTRAMSVVTTGQYTADKVYVKGIITSIKEISAQYGNATYNIADAADSETSMTVFRGYYYDGAKFTEDTLEAIKVGDELVIYGALTAYNGTPQINTGSSIITINGISAVAEIAADQAPVEYYNLQGVRVANPNNGIFIRRQGNKVTKVLVK